MNIIVTKIPDIDISNIDKSKVELSDNIIKNVYPLFDEIYTDKLEKLTTLKKELKDKREEVLNRKNNLEELIHKHKKQKKIRKLLERISKLVLSGLIYDTNLKHETIILLKVLQKMSLKKLDFHLSETMRIINKRFAK